MAYLHTEHLQNITQIGSVEFQIYRRKKIALPFNNYVTRQNK